MSLAAQVSPPGNSRKCFPKGSTPCGDSFMVIRNPFLLVSVIYPLSADDWGVLLLRSADDWYVIRSSPLRR